MSFNESKLSNSNYPRMSQSDWDRAPWNESHQEEKSFDVTISQTLSKKCELETDDYQEIYERLDPEDGYMCSFIDHSETDWWKAYSDNGNRTPLQLILLLRNVAEDLYEKASGNTAEQMYWLGIVDNCNDWVEDDLEIVCDE